MPEKLAAVIPKQYLEATLTVAPHHVILLFKDTYSNWVLWDPVPSKYTFDNVPGIREHGKTTICL